MQSRKVISHGQMKQTLERHKLFIETDGGEGEQANLSAVQISGYDFSGLDLSGVIDARESTFDHCRFVGCDLYGLSFSGSSAHAADFSDAVLVKAEIYNANFSSARFDRANMVQAEIINTRLQRASFREARLRAAVITNCDLTDAIFDSADTEHAAITDNRGNSVHLSDNEKAVAER